MSTQAITRVANFLWRRAGEPEKDYSEPTSVGYEDYRNQARFIIQGLVDMGYTIKRPPPRSIKSN